MLAHTYNLSTGVVVAGGSEAQVYSNKCNEYDSVGPFETLLEKYEERMSTYLEWPTLYLPRVCGVDFVLSWVL